MIHLGVFNTLNVLRETSNGVYLGHNQGDTGVLLPNKYVPENVQQGDILDVFVYTDSEDRLVATTLTPKIQLNEFAFLKVKAITPFGAFLDWGLEKDLLVPKREQNKPMRVGETHCVFLYIDEGTDRLAASARLEDIFQDEITVKEGEEVDLLIYRKTNLGLEVIINHLHHGLVYYNEIFQPVEIGDHVKGYIKRIREDGKIDVSLQKQGYAHIETAQQVLLDRLKRNNGVLHLSDKTDSGTIVQTLSMSKKAFKKAVGALYKERLIVIDDESIKLASR